MPSTMTLGPAYGRDYKSKKEAIADFLADKDFRDHSFGGAGGYISRRDIPDGQQVHLRYKKLTMSVLFRKGKEPKK